MRLSPFFSESARQGYGERGARPRIVGELDSAVVGLGDPFHDGEAQAEAAVLAGAGLVGAVEAVENVGGGFRGDADAGIRNADAYGSGVGVQFREDLASGRGVADGVVEQVDQQATEQGL